MKYFLDTEFIEGFHKPLFGKRRHFIDLISIGIKAEDGREYYAVSKEYNYNDASDWVKKNVIIPAYTNMVHGDQRNYCSEENFHKSYGKTNDQIALDIFRFVNPLAKTLSDDHLKELSILGMSYFIDSAIGSVPFENPDFVAYYADYDWVLLCSIFGTMMQLPKGFPMYCIDLKQMLDAKARSYGRISAENYNKEIHEKALNYIKGKVDYPKNTDEHIAIADARWNFELYKFLMES